MRKIFNWEQFNEAKGDKYLMPIFITEEFYDNLCKIESNITNDLIDYIQDPTPKLDITCFDYNKNSDDVSFVQTNRIKREFKLDDWSDEYSELNDKFFNVSGRTSIKIGRFIKKLLPNASDKDIELFANKWKSLMSSGSFEIVTGKSILEWYDEKKYVDGGGSLNNSCMKKKTYFLEIYKENPDVIGLLILKNEEGKLLGRALVWNLTVPEDSVFLDRIYTAKDSDIYKFIEYAKSKNWIYKKEQTYGEDSISNGQSIEAKIKKMDYSFYPYMDTLRYISLDTYTLYSSDSAKSEFDCYVLSNTNGLPKNYNGWDDWNNCAEYSSDLVWCTNTNQYCNYDDARYLEYIDEYFTPTDDSIKDLYDNLWYRKEDCIEHNGVMVYEKNIVDVVIDDDGNKKPMHKKDNLVCYIKTKNTYYLKSLCFLKGVEWHLIADGVKVYRRKDIIYTNIVGRNVRYIYQGAYMTIEDAKKYKKTLDLKKEEYQTKEEYELYKWVGLEDHKDVPKEVKDLIKFDIKNETTSSMYYKNFLYNMFGRYRSEKFINTIRDLKQKCLDNIDKDDVESIFDISDNGLYQIVIDTTENFKERDEYQLLKVVDDNGDIEEATYNLTYEQLIDFISKIYLDDEFFSNSSSTINNSCDKLFDFKMEYPYSFSNFLSSIESICIPKERSYYEEYISLNSSDIIYPS